MIFLLIKLLWSPPIILLVDYLSYALKKCIQLFLDSIDLIICGIKMCI